MQLFGKTTEVTPDSLKQLYSISVISPKFVTVVNKLHPLNALVPRYVKLGKLTGPVIFLLLTNASSPIYVTLDDACDISKTAFLQLAKHL